MKVQSWVLFAAVAAVIVGLFVVFEGQRRGSLAEIAKGLGLSFTAGQHRLPQSLDGAGFYLFTQGQPEIQNRMEGERDGYRVAVFEYAYSAGKGEEGSRELPPADVGQTVNRLQEVVWLHRPGQVLPDFDLSPTHQVLRRIAAKVPGMEQVAFDRRDAFNARYILYGREPEAVRRVFTSAVTGALAADPGWFVEGRGDQWLIYRLAERPEPAQISEFLDQAIGLVETLAHRPEGG